MPPSGGFRLFPTDSDPNNLALRRDKGGRGRSRQRRCVGLYFERTRKSTSTTPLWRRDKFCRDYAGPWHDMWGNERENKKLKWRGFNLWALRSGSSCPCRETVGLQRTAHQCRCRDDVASPHVVGLKLCCIVCFLIVLQGNILIMATESQTRDLNGDEWSLEGQVSC